jgi:hypothetical protein
MKKVRILSLVFLFVCVAALYAQQTTAPDQPPVAGTNTAAASTNKPAATDTNQPAVTPEKEVVASNSIVYNDGRIDFVSGDVKFLINAKDEGSGVKRVFDMLDDSQFGVYENPIDNLSEG